jgi:hypothetical protein
VPGNLLRPGKYVLIIEALWNPCAASPDSDYQSYCVKVLSKAKVKMSLTDRDENFFLQIMASRAFLKRDTSQIKPYQNQAHKGAQRIIESKSYESFYGSVVVLNDSPTLIEETFEFDRLENFEIVETKQLK